MGSESDRGEMLRIRGFVGSWDKQRGKGCFAHLRSRHLSSMGIMLELLANMKLCSNSPRAAVGQQLARARSSEGAGELGQLAGEGGHTGHDRRCLFKWLGLTKPFGRLLSIVVGRKKGSELMRDVRRNV